MATVTSTSAAALENPCGSPQPTSTGARSSERVAPPNAAERKPASVTPTWTADRKRFGSSLSSATTRPRRLWPARVRTWLSRKDTRAISAAAKTPPMRTKRTTSPMFASVPFTVYDLHPWTEDKGLPRAPVSGRVSPHDAQHDVALLVSRRRPTAHRRRGHTARAHRGRRAGALRAGRRPGDASLDHRAGPVDPRDLEGVRL